MPMTVGFEVKLDKDGTLFLVVYEDQRMCLYEHVGGGILRTVSTGKSLVDIRSKMDPFERGDLHDWLRDLIKVEYGC